MLTDCYGLALSITLTVARDSYIEGVDLLDRLLWRYGGIRAHHRR